jgi:hypothetical protein
LDTLRQVFVADSQLWPYEQAAGRKLPNAAIEDIMPFKAQAQALLVPKSEALVFAKTHSALRRISGYPTITPDVTAGAIYILRNPLDVTLSYADHFGLSHSDAISAMASPHLITMGRANRAPEFLGAWSGHVDGWTRAPGLSRLVLRYEDLQLDAADCLTRIIAFLQQGVDANKIERAVKNSSFETLSNQEALSGFKERSRNQKRFFRNGTSGQWREELTPDLIAKVIDAHHDIMTKYGYLDAKGEPV